MTTIEQAIEKSRRLGVIVEIELSDWSAAKAAINAVVHYWDFHELPSTATHRLYECWALDDDAPVGDVAWKILVRIPDLADSIDELTNRLGYRHESRN